MRALMFGVLAVGLTINSAACGQEQKVIYLDGVASIALTGDSDAEVSQQGKNAALPGLLKAGWRIESVHPSSDGKAHVVLIAPAKYPRK